MTDDVINKKEKLLIERIASNRALFVKCIRILKPEYFEKPLDRVVKFIKDYFVEYNNIAKFDVIEAETGIDLTGRELEADDFDYVTTELEKFCREQAMMQAVLKGVDFIEEGDMGAVEALVREALRVKLDNSLGTELFDDPVARIERMAEKKDHRRIGIDAIDDIIEYIGRGELGVLCAVSGGGKSLNLANIGYYLAKQTQTDDPTKHLNVLYISLELDEGLYSKRLDAITTNYDIKYHYECAKEIAAELERNKTSMGSMLVKRLPNGTTASDIRAFIMEYHIQRGYFPDVVMVDYLAGMGVDGMASLVGSNKHDVDKVKSEELREIMDEINAYGFTAAQINRDGQDVYSGINASHIQGGISLVQTSDWTLAMLQNQEDIDNNQIKMLEMKLRNSSKQGKMRTMYLNPKTLRFTNTPSAGTKSPTKQTLGKPAAKKKPTQAKDDQETTSKVKNALKKLR